MTDPTPEQLLDLARECMPHVERWRIDSMNRVTGWERTHSCAPPGFVHSEEFCGVLFDPATNPAHRMAVEDWLFDDCPERPKPYWCVEKSNEGGAQAIYTVIWDSEERREPECFGDALSAALAVLARMKGEK